MIGVTRACKGNGNELKRSETFVQFGIFHSLYNKSFLLTCALYRLAFIRCDVFIRRGEKVNPVDQDLRLSKVGNGSFDKTVYDISYAYTYIGILLHVVCCISICIEAP